MGGVTLQGHFFIKQRGRFLKLKRPLHCFLQNLGGLAPWLPHLWVDTQGPTMPATPLDSLGLENDSCWTMFVSRPWWNGDPASTRNHVTRAAAASRMSRKLLASWDYSKEEIDKEYLRVFMNYLWKFISSRQDCYSAIKIELTRDELFSYCWWNV